MIQFSFHETNGLQRTAEPVRIGVPLRRGALKASASLAVRDVLDGSIVPSHISPSSTWSDGSVEWLLIDFVVSISAHTVKVYELFDTDTEATSAIEPSPTGSKDADAQPDVRHVDMPCGSAQLSEEGELVLNFISRVCSQTSDAENRLDASAKVLITDREGHTHVARITHSLPIDPNNPVRKAFNLVLNCASLADSEHLKVHLEAILYPHSGLIDLELTLHNTAAAEHKHGLWDLGDPHSFHFREISLQILTPEAATAKLALSGQTESRSHNADIGLILVQHSSGGQNRLSTTHVDANGELHIPDMGFELVQSSLAHMDAGEQVTGEPAIQAPETSSGNTHTSLEIGERATPCAYIQAGHTTQSPPAMLAIHPQLFWQEFPNALSVSTTQTRVRFFSGQACQELQPGERKRRGVSLRVAPAEMHGSWIAQRLMPPVISGTGVLADEVFLRRLEHDSAFGQSLNALMAPASEFLNKREVIDEYGWRHFGEVFADHESLYQPADEQPLISHYNNQYDLVLGFGLHYLRTGDSQWFELMNDLARHVVDIDIYQTEKDRVEFNNGLFWHTNHYVDAATASHRTYSRANFNPQQPIGCSGGPGIEHCYTTGLLLHYRLTGDQASADAVLGLARWALAFHEGDSTVLATLLSIWRHEVQAIRAIRKGQHVDLHTNPFTRSTGNLVVAMLDAYSLTTDNSWLHKAEKILLGTFDASDDIDARGLRDIERGWSYTVFLQSVLRYLDVKASLDEFDDVYTQVKYAYLAYAQWMLEHEQPYLDTPELLEFPNDTWAAQDLRKQTLMIAAAALDPSRAAQFTDKAIVFERHTLEQLGNSFTRDFSRIQALILWNAGLASNLQNQSVSDHASTSDTMTSRDATASCVQPSVKTLCSRALTKLIPAIRTLRPAAELRWLRQRR